MPHGRSTPLATATLFHTIVRIAELATLINVKAKLFVVQDWHDAHNHCPLDITSRKVVVGDFARFLQRLRRRAVAPLPKSGSPSRERRRATAAAAGRRTAAQSGRRCQQALWRMATRKPRGRSTAAQSASPRERRCRRRQACCRRMDCRRRKQACRELLGRCWEQRVPEAGGSCREQAGVRRWEQAKERQLVSTQSTWADM